MANTKHIEIGDDNVRYGISPMDLDYAVEYGVQDEMFVRGRDGKIYYKRESDGQIVTYDKTIYNRFELVQNMILAHKMDKDVAINTIFSNNNDNTVWGSPSIDKPLKYADDFENYGVIYQTINIADRKLINDETVDLKKTGKIPINLRYEFPNDTNPYGLYVRIHGNDELNSFLTAISYPRNYIVAEIEYTIDNSVKTKYYPIGFNTLIHIDREALSQSTDDKISYILLKNIWINTSINGLINENTNISKYNLVNPLFEPTNIDIISYNDISDSEVISDRYRNDDSNLIIVDMIKLKDFDFITTSLSGGGDINYIDNSTNIEGDTTIVTEYVEGDTYEVTNIYGEQGDGLRGVQYYPTSKTIQQRIDNGASQLYLNNILKNINAITIKNFTLMFTYKISNIVTVDSFKFTLQNSTSSISNTITVPSSNVNENFESIMYIDIDSNKINNKYLLNDLNLYINTNNGKFYLYIYDMRIVPRGYRENQ